MERSLLVSKTFQVYYSAIWPQSQNGKEWDDLNPSEVPDLARKSCPYASVVDSGARLFSRIVEYECPKLVAATKQTWTTLMLNNSIQLLPSAPTLS
ncbi:unnamed protein product [Dibothriocephalus latus]|uniref:Uncharacterized protein n=1 Tax=Dibothriocephalus latus TaxID=60516 RepID=A0A3P7LPJ8_DIBLA|nr:unnamed protein product [Dibothriocephalus latus]